MAISVAGTGVPETARMARPEKSSASSVKTVISRSVPAKAAPTMGTFFGK